MSGNPVQTRRSFLTRASAVAAGAALSTQVVGQPGAGAKLPSTPTVAGATVLGARTAAGSTSGFRVSADARLSIMERNAELAPLAQDGGFRAWAIDRVERIEQLRGVVPDDQAGDPWRNWICDRLTTVEAFLPAPLRFPFYTHIPLEVSGPNYGPFLRQRIAAGECNGIFLYGNPYTPLAPNATLDSITGSGPPVPILMSPKNVSDPVTLKAWMDYWAARPEWIPYIRVAYWQEPQGDFGGTGQPPISQWHQGVVTLADAADRVGIASAAHVETWHLDPSQPHGGVPRLLEFLQPVIHRLGAGLSWSVFVFNQKSEGGPDCIRRMNEFMASYFPHSTYGAGSYGDSVPPSTPPDSSLRLLRAERVAEGLTLLDASRARYAGYYALAAPSNPEWSFWDEFVAVEVWDALDDLAEAGRATELRQADSVVLAA